MKLPLLPLIERVTKVVTYQTERYQLVDDVEFRVTLVDGELPHPSAGGIACKFEHCSHFSYVRDGAAFREECKTRPFNDVVLDDARRRYWWDSYVIENLYEECSNNEFNPDNLIAIKDYDHTFLDRFGKRLDMVVELDYIGGFQEPDRNSRYDTQWRWEELKAHLKAHPNIINFEENPIPSYNADFYGQTGLRIRCLYQSDWTPIGRQNLRESLTGCEKFDPLNVRQFDDRFKKKSKKKK